MIILYLLKKQIFKNVIFSINSQYLHTLKRYNITLQQIYIVETNHIRQPALTLPYLCFVFWIYQFVSPIFYTSELLWMNSDIFKIGIWSFFVSLGFTECHDPEFLSNIAWKYVNLRGFFVMLLIKCLLGVKVLDKIAFL